MNVDCDRHIDCTNTLAAMRIYDSHAAESVENSCSVNAPFKLPIKHFIGSEMHESHCDILILAHNVCISYSVTSFDGS